MCVPPNTWKYKQRKKSPSMLLPSPASTNERRILLELSLYLVGAGSFLCVRGNAGGYPRTMVSHLGRCLLVGTSLPNGSQVEAASRPEPRRVISCPMPEACLTVSLDNLPLTSAGDVSRSFTKESWRHLCWSRLSRKTGGLPKSG